MGVDAGHIVKHDFTNYGDRDAIIRYLNETAVNLRSFFKFKSCEIRTYEDYCDDDTFELYIAGADIINISFHHGFWLIDTGYKFYQYLRSNFVRRVFFDFTRALGDSEGWSCDDNHSWNYSKFDIDNGSFNDWLKVAKEDGIGEYAIDVVSGNEHNYCIIHDTFTDLYDELQILKKKFSMYEINTISSVGYSFIRAIHNDELFLIHKDTGERLLDCPIDFIDDDLNIPAFVVGHNGVSRLVCSNGEFLTAFVKGDFYSKGVSSVRKELPESAKMIVYNEKARIAFWTDWEKFEPMNIELALKE